MYLQEALKENGKARHKTMPEGWYITKDHDGLKFENEKGTTTLMTVKTLLDCDWEPYKEPCKHEPEHLDLNVVYELGVYKPKLGGYDMEKTTKTSTVYGCLCKHCGVKLEATGWREINSGNADNKTK